MDLDPNDPNNPNNIPLDPDDLDNIHPGIGAHGPGFAAQEHAVGAPGPGVCAPAGGFQAINLDPNLIPAHHLENDNFRIPAIDIPPYVADAFSDSPYQSRLNALSDRRFNLLYRRRDLRHRLICMESIPNPSYEQRQIIQRHDKDILEIVVQLISIDTKLAKITAVKSTLQGTLTCPPDCDDAPADRFNVDIMLATLNYTKKIIDSEDRLYQQWCRINSFARSHAWSHMQIKDALDLVLVGDHFTTYDLNRDLPLPEILKILSTRYITRNSFTASKQKLTNFSRQHGESLTAAMARFAEIFDQVSMIYSDSERPHRRSIHLEEALRKLTTKTAVAALERKLFQARQNGFAINIEQLIKCADLEESISGSPVCSSSANVRLYSSQIQPASKTSSASLQPKDTLTPSVSVLQDLVASVNSIKEQHDMLNKHIMPTERSRSPSPFGHSAPALSPEESVSTITAEIAAHAAARAVADHLGDNSSGRAYHISDENIQMPPAYLHSD